MSALRTLGPVAVVSGTPTPVYTGPVVAAVSFAIKKGIATINLGASNLPSVGYNQGQQVTLWGFTTATYFNGKVVTVRNNDGDGKFTFAFNHADVNSTNDAGNTAPAPIDKFRVVRLEVSQNVNTAHIIYVGDGNVSSSQYVKALSLAGQIDFEFAGQNIDASRIFIDGSNDGDTVQVSGVPD